MRNVLLMLSLSVMLLAQGCAPRKPQNVPLAVECPSPPPPPVLVVKSVSTRKPLVPQLNDIEDEFAASLKAATRQPSIVPR